MIEFLDAFKTIPPKGWVIIMLISGIYIYAAIKTTLDEIEEKESLEREINKDETHWR